LYFLSGKSPAVGRVVCFGEHGATLHDGTTQQKVRWGGILGHKERVSHAVTVVDQGADGAIVEDADGNRQYMQGYQAQDNMMKSLGGRSVLIFLKSDIVGRPGLTQEKRTDKTGKVVTRWISVDKGKPPKYQHGDHVKFQAGQSSGQGKIVTSGEHGATVHDGEHDHSVKWNEFTHHSPGQDSNEPNAKKALFTDQELSELPRDVRQQDVSSIDDLFSQAKEALEFYSKWLTGIADSSGFDVFRKGDEAVQSIEDGHKGGMLLLAPLKGEQRLTEKVQNEYEGEWDRVCDVVRGSLAVDSYDDVHTLMENLKSTMAEEGVRFAKIKDRFNRPLPSGYRDLMLVVTLPNGHHAELQVHIKSMLPAKKKGHVLYGKERVILGAASKEGRNLSDEEKQQVDKIREEQKAVYEPAWKTALGELKKSLHSAILFLGKVVGRQKEIQHGIL